MTTLAKHPRAFEQTVTALATATTMTVSLGTAANGTQFISSSSIRAVTGPALALTLSAANLGTAVTGAGITQTGTLGGFDVIASLNFTGSAPTAGAIVLILEYIAPNDGSCAAVPLGSTATGC